MLEKPGKRFRSVKGLDAGLEVKGERTVTKTQLLQFRLDLSDEAGRVHMRLCVW